jgi:hypothetical protein
MMTNFIDPVGFTGYRIPIGYYFEHYAPAAMKPPFELDGTYATDVKDPIKNASGAWLMVFDGHDPNANGQAAIQWMQKNRYMMCRVWPYNDGNTTLSEWQRLTGPVFTFGDQFQLQQTPLAATSDTYRPGDKFDLLLGFQAQRIPSLDYSVGLYVVDSTGKTVLQQDGPPANRQTSTFQPNESACDIHHLIAPTVPGKYSVQVAVYDWGTGTRLSVPPGDGVANNAVTVASFTVANS